MTLSMVISCKSTAVEGKYDQVFSEFYSDFKLQKEVSSKDEQLILKQYKLAHDHIKDDYIVEAISIFNMLSMNENFDFSQDAKWFLGLCHLREENLVEAKSIFSDISQNTDHKYQQSAIKIFNTLKE